MLNFEEGIEVCQLRGDRVASAMDWIVYPQIHVELLTFIVTIVGDRTLKS